MAPVIAQTHSYRHFEDLQLSANSFYDALEAAIREYQYPRVLCYRETLREHGLFSSNRDYFCIEKGKFKYYVCACPFGRSYFISWWLNKADDDFFNRFLKNLLGSMWGGGGTLYERDTELIFTQSINSIVQAMVDKVASEHGIRQDVTPVQ